MNCARARGKPWQNEGSCLFGDLTLHRHLGVSSANVYTGIGTTVAVQSYTFGWKQQGSWQSTERLWRPLFYIDELYLYAFNWQSITLRVSLPTLRRKVHYWSTHSSSLSRYVFITDCSRDVLWLEWQSATFQLWPLNCLLRVGSGVLSIRYVTFWMGDFLIPSSIFVILTGTPFLKCHMLEDMFPLCKHTRMHTQI